MSSAAFTLDDPRPISRDAPYTYFLPLPERLDAVEPGDLVQLVFRSRQPTKWGAERMWVEVGRRDGEDFEGILISEPDDMPELRPGTPVSFSAHHVIDFSLKDEGRHRNLPADPRPDYWDRCIVDACVLHEGVSVGFLYRETPDMNKAGDNFADSGWRVRGDVRGVTPEEIEAREAAYVALGAVLNRDDSWLHLIDEPVGSRFERDFGTGAYARVGETRLETFEE